MKITTRVELLFHRIGILLAASVMLIAIVGVAIMAFEPQPFNVVPILALSAGALLIYLAMRGIGWALAAVFPKKL
jgi:hypothetical protein